MSAVSFSKRAGILSPAQVVSIKIIEQFLKFFNVTCHMVGKDIHKYLDLVSHFVLVMVPQYSLKS